MAFDIFEYLNWRLDEIESESRQPINALYLVTSDEITDNVKTRKKQAIELIKKLVESGYKITDISEILHHANLETNRIRLKDIKDYYKVGEIIPGERWKVIEDWPMYEVSDYGRVRKTGDETCKSAKIGSITSQGYLMVTLSDYERTKKSQTHRLVAAAFIPNPENKPFVNHIDEVRHHNHYTNLEWVNQSENIIKGNVTTKLKVQSGKPVRCIELDRIFTSLSDAARFLIADENSGINTLNSGMRTIKDNITGKRKNGGGYNWEYVDEE